jgi:hypothetical protein
MPVTSTVKGVAARRASSTKPSLTPLEDQIRGTPNFYRDRDYDWSDRQRERELHDYWKAPYYWGI